MVVFDVGDEAERLKGQRLAPHLLLAGRPHQRGDERHHRGHRGRDRHSDDPAGHPTPPALRGQDVRLICHDSIDRRLATSASATAAATLAFRDSTSELIGIATRKSQVLPTSRDNPRPSEPTTPTSGATATSRSYSPVGASASRPTTTCPSCWHAFSARVRLVTRDTGNRAAAPALVRQAVAVMPAARRFGTNTPWAPNAAAERITAPRLRGSVTPSSATSSGGSGCSEAAASRSSNGRYEYGGTWSPIPWCSAPPESRSSSDRLTSRIASPRSLAVRTLSLTRSSMSIPYATYSAVAGIRARSASTTGLRPTSSSGPSWEARLPAPDRLSAARAALEPGPGRPTFGGRPFSAAARRSRSCLRAVPRGTSSPEYALC